VFRERRDEWPPVVLFIEAIRSPCKPFFSSRRNGTRMTKGAMSSRLPEGGIHPGEALCLISPGVPETGYPRIAGEVVHS